MPDERDRTIPPTPDEDPEFLRGDDFESADTTVIYQSGEDSEADARIAQLIEADATPEELAPYLSEQEPADAADTLEELDRDESVEVLRLIERDAAADALAHMEPALARTVLLDMEDAEAAELLRLMDPDDAVDLIQELEEDEAERIFRRMPRTLAANLRKLSRYDPECAGGLMNTDVLAIPASLTVAQAIDFLRHDPIFQDRDNAIEFLFCIDEDQRLVGVLTVRDLLVAPDDNKLVSELMDREVDAIRPTLDREEVAREFSRYDYVALPVIDGNDRLLGVVTIDDVIDIIEAEQTEDVNKQVGAGARESSASRLGQKLRGRSPWLIVNLFTSTVAAIIVLRFEGLIAQLALLAVLMPLIANQAGNAGQQSLAVTLRGIILDEIRRGRSRSLLAREVLVGAISGTLNGFLVFIVITVVGATGLVEGVDYRLGLVAWIAMIGALSVGCLAGASIPLAMNRLGADPATASTIFLTMLTDSLSFFAFLGLAYVLRGWLLDPASAEAATATLFDSCRVLASC